jgi:hypothetical protein
MSREGDGTSRRFTPDANSASNCTDDVRHLTPRSLGRTLSRWPAQTYGVSFRGQEDRHVRDSRDQRSPNPVVEAQPAMIEVPYVAQALLCLALVSLVVWRRPPGTPFLGDAAPRRKGLGSDRLLTMRPQGDAGANCNVRFVVDLVLCLVGCGVALIWKSPSRVRFIVRPLARISHR